MVKDQGKTKEREMSEVTQGRDIVNVLTLSRLIRDMQWRDDVKQRPGLE
jgi:hypothetical protein